MTTIKRGEPWKYIVDIPEIGDVPDDLASEWMSGTLTPEGGGAASGVTVEAKYDEGMARAGLSLASDQTSALTLGAYKLLLQVKSADGWRDVHKEEVQVVSSALAPTRVEIAFEGVEILSMEDDDSQPFVSQTVGYVEFRFEEISGGKGYRRFRFTNHGRMPYVSTPERGDWFHFDSVKLWLDPSQEPRWTRDKADEGDGTRRGGVDAAGRQEWIVVAPTDDARVHQRGKSATPIQPLGTGGQALPGTYGLGLEFGPANRPMEAPLKPSVDEHFKALGMMSAHDTTGDAAIDYHHALYTGGGSVADYGGGVPRNVGQYLVKPSLAGHTSSGGYQDPFSIWYHGAAIEGDGTKAGTTYRYWFNLLLAQRARLFNDSHAFELFLRGAREKATRMFVWNQVVDDSESLGYAFQGLPQYERSGTDDYAGGTSRPSRNHAWMEDVILARAYMPGDPLLEKAVDLHRTRMLRADERIWTRDNAYSAIRSIDRWLHNLLFLYCLEPDEAVRTAISGRIDWLIQDTLSQARAHDELWFHSANGTVSDSGFNCEAWMGAGALLRMCQAMDLGLVSDATDQQSIESFSRFACNELVREDATGVVQAAYWAQCSVDPGMSAIEAKNDPQPWFLPLIWVVGKNWDHGVRWKAARILSEFFADYNTTQGFGDGEGSSQIKNTGQAFWMGARPDAIAEIKTWSTTPVTGGVDGKRDLGIFPAGYTPGADLVI